MARILCVVLSILGIGIAAVLSAPSESCSCGKKKANETSNHTRPKVIKGQDADLDEYPWMVLNRIHKNDVVGCGAVVINSKWILTAKHCTEAKQSPIPEESFLMALGEWDINNELDTETRKDFEVVNIVRHPDVDMALMEVEGDIDLSIYTPICLPKPDFDVRGERITVAGWGAQCGEESGVDCDDVDQQKRFILQEADMPVPSNEECRQDKLDHVCFGGEEGKAICFGDSGSPVIYDDNGKWTLVTLVANFGPGSAICNGEPGNYQGGPEITKFLEWIEDNTKGGTSCKD